MEHLCSTIAGPVEQILEIGCGPNSPWVEVLKALFPRAKILQIDALASVVAQARSAHPDCQVEQMLASDMKMIRDGSQDLIVGMSVFDQNPRRALAGIAQEIYRVMKQSGRLVYLHNEELNLPAQAASWASEKQWLMLPSPRWTPLQNIEYCGGPRTAIESVIARIPAKLQPVVQYLLGILPQIYSREQSAVVGEVRVPFLHSCDPERMSDIRQAVDSLEKEMGSKLHDFDTNKLLQEHLTEFLFSKSNGFEIELAGMFEQRGLVNWSTCFSARPPTRIFVRGCSRYGYTCNEPPSPNNSYCQLSPALSQPTEKELLLVGYQFGLRAHKVGR